MVQITVQVKDQAAAEAVLQVVIPAVIVHTTAIAVTVIAATATVVMAIAAMVIVVMATVATLIAAMATIVATSAQLLLLAIKRSQSGLRITVYGNNPVICFSLN